jgi:nucleotidyltransferase-like protein
MPEAAVDVARRLLAVRYAGAAVAFAAGSIVRGEGTPQSDLDLVVIHETLDHAYRESFRADGLPVEAFVHDPATLDYFFVEIDARSGVPSLPQMVVEGVEIPGPTSLSRVLKARAAAVLAAGPPLLDADTERRLRYFVSDLMDDLRSPRSRDELMGAGARLYDSLADYALRRIGRWSARGKAISRALRQYDPGLAAAYGNAFAALFTQGDPAPVLRLAEDLLRDAGGPLFDGFRLDAPRGWRRQPPTA